ncbi:MAG: 2-oxoacid:acceptor oxidoreductase family protein [Gammaproteobacteria bacterium]|nr:2-oxoacid:acceptor oxidoreductase family protein [Gammaproteobacteria bacterium]
MISKVLAELCRQRGDAVKQSEVHGMAKRGGPVFSHVRYGREVWSPTIPRGEADVLVALEWAEGLRWLGHLKPVHGIFICDTRRIVPPFACLDRRPGASLRYSGESLPEALAHVGEGYAFDATSVAAALGNDRAANTVLLGALSTALDFAAADWEAVIAAAVPPKTVAVNLEAFRRGRAHVEEERVRGHRPEPAAPVAAAQPQAPPAIRVEITPAWCKSCDICVKLCPERCLSLNADRIVELSDPAACTGCRLCEWLCPDFAIRVHVEATT